MEIMGALQLHPPLPLFKHTTTKSYKLSSKLSMSRGFHKLNALETNSPSGITDLEEELPSIDFAFVSPKLLPDGSPDVHIRSAVGGQKLRDIMLDGNIDLYGPYDIPLSNCAGGGTCGTCMVEVVEGKELLSPRTDKEKEILKRKPKTWRLACQTVVGKPDSRGELIIQQLPEWKAHEWE
ncbi:photosynthetic NDH subunit of subcomplex B 3, chloroplastic [Dioscorea cayenensis subsp. rotundata]|uniref:Photosynthetic NDH subunit of subcomplex B 3, chloroplastic n=1 Tax=Dioscorea cayennensis subsp. rotundata TaxID=55577 RepID=A0AB40B6F7_DIOCR|nr:photosynthetic NDH subunit of subcomplex B 3, chloroplastic [Dioscorea cayenensis subsp. rotundata]